jgi:hypothetical protein
LPGVRRPRGRARLLRLAISELRSASSLRRSRLRRSLRLQTMNGPCGPLIGAGETLIGAGMGGESRPALRALGEGEPRPALYSNAEVTTLACVVQCAASAPRTFGQCQALRGKRASQAPRDDRCEPGPGTVLDPCGCLATQPPQRGEGAARPPRLEMRLNRALRLVFNRAGRRAERLGCFPSSRPAVRLRRGRAGA